MRSIFLRLVRVFIHSRNVIDYCNGTRKLTPCPSEAVFSKVQHPYSALADASHFEESYSILLGLKGEAISLILVLPRARVGQL
jgi:hypothetical protein